MSCCLLSIVRLFVHPLSSISFSLDSSGALKVRLWEFVFLCVFVHPVDSFRVLILREFFLSVFDS